MTEDGRQKYEPFLFYGSWRETLEGFAEGISPEFAKEALWNLMLCATAGDIETDNKVIIGFINGCCMPNIDKVKERYRQSIENGKKGGRPRTVDRKEVAKLKEQGLTNKEVATKLKCSVSSVEKANKENRDEEQTRKNQKNLEEEVEKEEEKEKEVDNCFSANAEKIVFPDWNKQSDWEYLKSIPTSTNVVDGLGF